MLDELRVRDIALIEQASLAFGAGLSVLTGETGAGKTVLLNALKLLVGERADPSCVRDGASELRAEAVFNTSCDDEASGFIEYLATRRVGIDGRSRCTLNDEMVTVKRLSETLGPLIDLCGQHEHQSLLSPDEHCAAIDLYGGSAVIACRASYQSALRGYRVARAEKERLEKAAHRSEREIEQAAFVLREIRAINPLEGEYEGLEAHLPRLRNGEELAQASGGAYQALRAEGGAIDALATAQRELVHLKNIDPVLDGFARQADEILILSEELAGQLRSYHDEVEFDPIALERALDRLGQLEGLRKRFGPRMIDVFEARDNAERILGSIEDIEGQQRTAALELERTRALLEETASQLEHARACAGTSFVEKLTKAVKALAMDDAVFTLDIKPLEFEAWAIQGSCKYELLYQPTATSTPRSLSKIASGGELSRVMLAYKGITHEVSSPMTLVFDEIDTGLGGATATVIANRLAELSRIHQVIVVTHLAQIAALADAHWVVERSSDGDTTTTRIFKVEGEVRVSEIARMLAGERDDLAREHARQLLGERL